MTDTPSIGDPISRVHADTNVVIALLAGPAHPFHDEALALFRRVAEGSLELIVSPVIVAEVIFVARRVIGWRRAQAAERIASFLAADGIRVREERIVERALRILATRPLDFADAYLVALAEGQDPATIASFDRDLDGIEGVRRIPD